jgi:GNAT superfamily N-acetyltransferase
MTTTRCSKTRSPNSPAPAGALCRRAAARSLRRDARFFREPASARCRPSSSRRAFAEIAMSPREAARIWCATTSTICRSTRDRRPHRHHAVRGLSARASPPSCRASGSTNARQPMIDYLKMFERAASTLFPGFEVEIQGVYREVDATAASGFTLMWCANKRAGNGDSSIDDEPTAGRRSPLARHRRRGDAGDLSPPYPPRRRGKRRATAARRSRRFARPAQESAQPAPAASGGDLRRRGRGYAYVVLFRKRPAYRYTVKHSIYVHHEHLGRGIGRLLMQELIDVCAAAGFRQMIGYIDADNHLRTRKRPNRPCPARDRHPARSDRDRGEPLPRLSQYEDLASSGAAVFDPWRDDVAAFPLTPFQRG